MIIEFPVAKMCTKCTLESLGLHGMSVTIGRCAICEDEIYSGSTFIDRYCAICAIQLNACPHCGEEHVNQEVACDDN